MRQLDEYKQTMIKYLEQKMSQIAPNTCEILGSSLTSKMVASAGGIVELSKMPACNIQVLGSQKKALNGLSTQTASLHRGHLQEMEMVQSAPPAY